MFVTDDAMLLSIITQGSLSHITLDSITSSGDPDQGNRGWFPFPALRCWVLWDGDIFHDVFKLQKS